MQIDLDGRTKIIAADKLKFARPKKGHGEAPDLANDVILIICPRTFRPIATINPIAPGPGTPPARPPAPAADSAAGAAPDDRAAVVGPLTLAERERLVRLWQRRPHDTPAHICAEFARAAGRTISEPTAAKYRPSRDPAPPPGEPTPAEIRARALAIKPHAANGEN